MFALFQPCAGHAFTDAAVLHEILFLGLNQFSKQAKGYVNEDNGCICSKMVRAEIPVLAHPPDNFLCGRKPGPDQLLRVKTVVFPLFLSPLELLLSLVFL